MALELDTVFLSTQCLDGVDLLRKGGPKLLMDGVIKHGIGPKRPHAVTKIS